MSNLFNPDRKFILESHWRKNNLPPYEVLKLAGIKSTDTMADIGCGIGFFTFPAAEYTDGNTIYALDVQDEMLEVVRSRKGNQNIVPVKTEPYDLKIGDKTVSFAFMASVLHEIEDKPRFLKELLRVLKPEGRLALIEWQKKNLKLGPGVHEKYSPDEVREIMKDYLVHERTFEINEFFYGMVFIRKS